jgi:quercetin dioxygenase-like cupin family protein
MKKLIILLIVCLFGYANAAQTSDIVVDVISKTGKSWDGTKLKTYPKGQPEVTILKITIPAHTKLAWHKHPVINAGILLKGKLSVIKENGDSLKLKEGDTIVELVDTWHYGINESDEIAQIIVFYAGIKDKAITIKK